MGHAKAFCAASTLLLLWLGAAYAEPHVLVTRDIATVTNLMDTDLVRIRGMLDCELRLEGSPPHYKLIYSLGQIPVSTLAVKKDYDHSHMLLSVEAEIDGLPITELFVRYHDATKGAYELEVNCHGESTPCDAPVAYVMRVKKPEQIVLNSLLSRHGDQLIVNGRQGTDVNPGAIMIRDRPGLVSPAMDGLNGAETDQETNLHYVCATK